MKNSLKKSSTKLKQKSQPKKEWKDFSRKEKHNAYAAMVTFSIFVISWLASNFRAAVMMVSLGYFVYFLISTIHRTGFRKKNAITAAIFLILTGVAAPYVQPNTTDIQNTTTVQTQKQVEETKRAEAERLRKIEAAKPKVKSETKTETVKYKTIETNDSSIPLGEKRVSIEGVVGERTISYEVTYVNGTETKREEIKNVITTEPVNRVILVGTYVAPPAPQPAPAQSSSGGGSGYINSQGNYIQSPSSNPAGASAQCRDGTYSYSQSRRGTCSHHGGVAAWL
jgi:hypothetical protein